MAREQNTDGHSHEWDQAQRACPTHERSESRTRDSDESVRFVSGLDFLRVRSESRRSDLHDERDAIQKLTVTVFLPGPIASHLPTQGPGNVGQVPSRDLPCKCCHRDWRGRGVCALKLKDPPDGVHNG